jgi:hypothetical protein
MVDFLAVSFSKKNPFPTAIDHALFCSGYSRNNIINIISLSSMGKSGYVYVFVRKTSAQGELAATTANTVRDAICSRCGKPIDFSAPHLRDMDLNWFHLVGCGNKQHP